VGIWLKFDHVVGLEIGRNLWTKDISEENIYYCSKQLCQAKDAMAIYAALIIARVALDGSWEWGAEA